MVDISAGSSKTVTVKASATEDGSYTFNVSVYTLDGELVETVPLNLKVEGKTRSVADPVVVLTIVLAVIFLILLVVLIVLVGKKPQKAEELGESYY